MRHISVSLRQLIFERAGNRCEYCGLSQAGQAEDNLALACVSCSLRKAARLTAPDPHTDEEVSIYNPRQQAWLEHFHWDGVHVIGLTPTDRATVAALNTNRPIILAIRAEEGLLNRHPPPLEN